MIRVAILILSALALSAQPVPSPVRDFIAANAIRPDTPQAGNGFTDMQPLKAVVGGARIVSLGEATHGTREFFQLKHCKLEFLAAQMGFTIFGIEANMPEAYRLNDYVLHGTGDPLSLIKGMYFWTWVTEEVLDMVKWMREFNASGKGRLQVTGFDMQTPAVALQIAHSCLERHDPEYSASLRSAYGMVTQVSDPQHGFASATGAFPAAVAAGKHVKFSGYVKTDSVANGYAGLWFRADRGGEAPVFRNLGDAALWECRDVAPDPFNGGAARASAALGEAGGNGGVYGK